MAKDRQGNRLVRRIEIRIVFPEGTIPEKKTVQVAPDNKAFSEDGIERMLKTIGERLERACPHWEFRLFELSAMGSTAGFVFRYAATREIPSSDPTQTIPS